MQLQDQIAISKVSVAMREKLEAGLDAANAAINELTGKYQAEIERAEQLAEINDSAQAKFDREIRQVRFELGAAEETIAGQETLNEQLVSDLVDHRSFRQALETQLGEVEQESNDSVAELNRELQKIRRNADDLERNLRNKDSVITELMQELAGRSDSIELKDDSGGGLQKIDGFKAETDEEQPLSDRDRVARQLIGNADGQELRFPLFKNRLTIGRTSNNDIQLNMQYISRRHAVISIDHNQTRVIDWGSKNGVFVNDTKVTEKILESGDIVTIGTTDFRYEERSKR
jgi:predicted  nucleic acid-binding Zn-ribbon protein